MLNIFIFSPISLENGRGGEISTIELASELNKFYNISLIDTNFYLDKKLLTRKEIEKKLKGVKKSFQLKNATLKIFNKNFSFPYPWDIIKLFKKIRKNDIIYFSYSTIKINLIFILFSLLHRSAKYIVGYRKPLFSKKIFSLYNLKYRISILILSLFKKRFYHHTISYHAKEFLENFYIPNKIVHIIHGVDLYNYQDESKEKKRDDILKFIYVGHLDDIHKGVGVLLSGIRYFLKENKNLKVFFEFCGSGPLESRIRELEKKFPKNVKFNGYISNDKIPEYYKKNDVFLFTSRREPFGRVIIEALASKLVILCTKTFGSIEILKGKEFAFFLQELNVNAIKEKLYEIYNLWMENPEKFKKLQDSTKDYAFHNYSFSKELEIFKEFINKIIKE